MLSVGVSFHLRLVFKNGVSIQMVYTACGSVVGRWAFNRYKMKFQTGVVSDEDTNEIWEVTKRETIEKARGNKNRSAGVDSPVVDEKEEEKSFWLSRPDDWVVNKQMKTLLS